MTRSLLIVDDSEGDLGLMRLAIDEIGWGVEVATASDGVDALERLHDATDGAANPDLMVIDLNMPRMNGWELLDRLQSREFHGIRRVVLTSSSVPADCSRAQALGAERCFVKSPDFDGLVATARQMRAMIDSGAHRVPGQSSP
ncbi:MAG TPA: response regulator [Planctomycetota bacterium]|nr:response regulator [Planctomycetota bacterium]